MIVVGHKYSPQPVPCHRFDIRFDIVIGTAVNDLVGHHILSFSHLDVERFGHNLQSQVTASYDTEHLLIFSTFENGNAAYIIFFHHLHLLNKILLYNF